MLLKNKGKKAEENINSYDLTGQESPFSVGKALVRKPGSDGLGREHLGNFALHDRTAPDVALNVVALVFGQDIELSSVVNALGDNTDLHLVHKTDDGSDHETLCVLDRQIVNKGLIDLQNVDRELTQIVQ